MAQRKITYDDKSNNVTIVDRTKQATAEDFQDIKDTVNNNVDDINDRFYREDINLVANTDYNIPNPHSFTDAIPQIVQVKALDGTVILDAYLNVNQSTGDITIQVGSDFNNAIITSIGW